MLILNPERLQATRDPLLPRQRVEPRFAAIARIALAVATACVAAVAGFAVTQYLADAWPLWIAVAAGGGFVYLASLTALTVEGVRWHVPMGVIWGAAFALGLPWRAGAEAFSIAGIVAAAAVLAYVSYATAVSSYATLHTFTVARRYASLLATGVVVALIVLYGAALSRGSALLPQGVLANLTDQAAQLVPTFAPGVKPANGTSTISVNDLAEASVRAQLEDDPRYRELTYDEQQEVVRKATAQAAASFSKQLGVASSSPDASIGSVAQGAVTGFLGRFHDRYGWYFTAAWLLGAFFIARSAAFLLTVLIAGLAWLTVTAALSLGVMQVETVASTRERLIL